MKRLIVIFIACGFIFAGCPDPDAEYSVTYHSNGTPYGYAPTDGKKYKIGEEAVVRNKNTLDNPGHKFESWNTKSDGSGGSYEPGSIITINGAVFLYAIWKQE